MNGLFLKASAAWNDLVLLETVFECGTNVFLVTLHIISFCAHMHALTYIGTCILNNPKTTSY